MMDPEGLPTLKNMTPWNYQPILFVFKTELASFKAVAKRSFLLWFSFLEVTKRFLLIFKLDLKILIKLVGLIPSFEAFCYVFVPWLNIFKLLSLLLLYTML